jgi:hypothetical protein
MAECLTMAPTAIRAKREMVAAAGVELERRVFSNVVTARDFWA